ncbi:MAG TPA: L-threonylcarbamoyladenylate synthase type 1 TsaC, partial [Cryomorphaceae bacterium]|nr:L-threonylcarbamoyladenylate synthase type 1 TsaC [Cryomorphaceae bacterium]
LRLFKSYSELLSEFNTTDTDRIGLLYSGKEIKASFAINLSKEKVLVEVASKLFHALRSFDKADIDVIWAHELPEVGLGRAINDRLRRAES